MTGWRIRRAPTPAARGGRAPRPALSPRRWALDLGASALLLAVGIAGFWPTFAGPSYLGAAVGALVLGLGIAAVCAWRRWGALPIAGLTVAAYFVFGGALALPQTSVLGVIPTIDTIGQLAVGVVESWKSLLTTVAPVAASDGFLIVPFLLTLVAAVLTGSLALRLRRPAWALLPAAVYLAVQIAFGMAQPAAPVIQGIVFAVVAIGWLAVRQALAPADENVMVADGSRSGGTGTHRLLAGALVLVLAGGVGAITTAFTSPASPRQVLREVVIPPFDVRQYPSPLQSYRRFVRDDENTTLFTVTGLPKGARVRLATMDAYTGVVYDVATGGGSSGSFTPLQSNMSAGAEGARTTVRVRIQDLTGVWLPDVGSVESFTFTGANADALRRAGNYNASSGTAVVTSGLTKGDAYAIDTVVPPQPGDTALKKASFAPITLPRAQAVPDIVATKAADIVAKATTPIGQVRALQKALSTDGYFSHGLPGEVTSLPGHGADRISTMLGAQQMVGDDEQYAVAMALMARSLGIPARVVMGFHPDDPNAAPKTFTAKGGDLHAWVEVAFQGFGWVAFDPTPPKDHVATNQRPQPKPQPKPQVPQPPPPPQQSVEQPPMTQKDAVKADKENPLGAILLAVLAVGGSAAGVAAILLAPFVVIGGLKAARRRRRRAAERPIDRISGGWDELVDRASDFGARVSPGATRVEDAAVVATTLAEPRVTTLARRADGEVFGPAEPSPDDIDEFWRQVDDIVTDLDTKASPWRRVRARLSLHSLIGQTRAVLAVRRAGATVVESARTAKDAVRRGTGTGPDTRSGAENRSSGRNPSAQSPSAQSPSAPNPPVRNPSGGSPS